MRPLVLLAQLALACAARAPARAASIEVAITVDDLPSHGPLPPGLTRERVVEQMLAAFRKHALPQVYGFVNGAKLARLPEGERILRRWLESGNPLANHTFSHANLNELPLDEWLADVQRNEPLLERLAPDGSWKVFRYPYLFEGDEARKKAGARSWLQERGYLIAEVSIEAEDWAYNPAYARCLAQANAVAAEELRRGFVKAHVDELRHVREVARALVGREIRHVLLLHVGALDADRLDALLTAYEAEGVRWIDLRTALADPIYQMEQLVPLRSGPALPYALLKGRDVHPPKPPPSDEDRLSKLCPEPQAAPIP